MHDSQESPLARELHAFLDREVPRFHQRWSGREQTVAARIDWQRTMAAGKWAAPAWAVENGGRGAGADDLLALEEVNAQFGMPLLIGTMGIKNVGPTIAAWGTERQREHLPRIMMADEIWCQGFSEPEAGSDLASLRTRAVRDGDEFVVNGQKIWTSQGMEATHIELLVRTNPDEPRHRGISVLLVDLSSPGIERRPIRQIDGNAEFAEVFFTDVRVPAENLLGPLNEGWRVTRTTLGHERSGAAIFCARLEHQVGELIARHTRAARREALPAVLADDLVRRHVEARVLSLLSRRMINQLAAGEEPGATQSVIKLVFSEIRQRLAGTMFDLDDADGRAAAAPGELEVEYLTARSATIAAGTSQIVRNILAERVLQLPRD
ncbi:acyl-CoA dehydrogenase family protein [Pseudonocardia sp. CA-107938]|uniref:acyl-CoA dehydrogenase family protein n=1 Tax=Pseudonocardia sp. CA-107938 TaxID=3240021 RepID=UPI003D90BE6A